MKIGGVVFNYLLFIKAKGISMKYAKKILLLVIFLSQSLSSAYALTALEILKQSDKVRNPNTPFSTNVTLVEYNKAKQVDRLVLKVHSKVHPKNGQYRTLVKFVQPTKDKGKLMLRNGNELWFYDPAASNSIRLSAQQRLLGQSSNGDVMTANFALDYHVKLIGEKRLKDANKKTRQTYHLFMKAKNNSVTYASADFWVDKKNYQPVKAKFYSSSKRLMKIVYYRRYQNQLGGMRPTEVLIIDGIDTKKVTRMQLNNYRAITIPEAWFQRSYLPRFKG